MNLSVCVFYGNFKRFGQFCTKIWRTQAQPPHTTKSIFACSSLESLSENGEHNSGLIDGLSFE